MINVFHIASGKNWGGVEQYTYDLTSRLRHDPHFYTEVVCRKTPAILTRFRQLEIPISILPLKGITDIDSPTRLARLLRKGQNIVHVHSFRDAFTAMWARRISENQHGTRIVMTVHDIDRPRDNYLYRKIYKSIDLFVFVSQMAHDTFMSRVRKRDQYPAVVLRDSVIPAKPTAAENLRERLGLTSQQALIMFHGRLCHEKGIDVALRAITQLDKSTYHMVVMGSGKPKFLAQLKGFIVANQLLRNVSLLGFRNDVQALIAQCDFGVLPSVAPEPLGIANLEYMMQGKAHITTNNGAQHEYVRDGKNGLLVSPDNHFHLAAAIKGLIENPQARQRMGAQAKSDFDAHLNYTVFYRAISEIYQQFFNQK